MGLALHKPPGVAQRSCAPPAPLAGRGGALKLVRGDRGFSDHEPVLAAVPNEFARETTQREDLEVGAQGFWDETPSRVVPVLLLDANGHISQTAWPEHIGMYSSKKTTFNGQCLGELLRDHHLRAANTYFLVGRRLSLDPSPTPRSTLPVSQLLFMFTDVVHCTTMGIDCNWQQLWGEGYHRPNQCVFQHQLTYGIHEKKGKEHQWDKNKLTTGCPVSRRTRPPFCHGWREAGTMKSGTIWRSPIFGRNSIKWFVKAGSGLYAREIQAKISTPQDNMTKAKLEVMKLPPRRPKN